LTPEDAAEACCRTHRGAIDPRKTLRHPVAMLRQAIIRLHRSLILVVLAVALVATGFAHRAPSQTENAVAAMLLAGGSLADLCGDRDPDGAPGHGDCLACQITAAADLPPTSGVAHDLGLVLLAKVAAPRADRAIPRRLDPAHGPQGPPTV